jgi:FKBP-type peptidyl-prolyl cis-trans isomerase 2
LRSQAVSKVACTALPLNAVNIEKNRRVRIKVKLQVEDGDVLEESAVEYFHGAGNMLEGLEEELEGLEAGAKKNGIIPAKKAFGGAAHQHEKLIPRNEFPEDAELKVGTSFVAGGGDGQNILIEVVEISDTEIKAVLKHPLADKNIVYEVEVLSVTDPAPPPMPSDALVDDES